MNFDVTTTQIPGVDTSIKITAYLHFPEGWKYGHGHAPRTETVRAALQLNEIAALAALDTDAFLGQDGEIRVTVYHGQNYLQFTIDDVTGKVEFVREDGDVELAREPVLSLAEALKTLEDFRLELWNSSASSTAPTTILVEDISKTSHSAPLDAERVFQWLKKTVQSDEAAHFAHT